MDLRGRDRTVDAERVRRRDLHQQRENSQHVPAQGGDDSGADADITVWDPKANKTISARKQMSVIDYNVFEGINVTGLPRLHPVARRRRLPPATVQ